MKNYLDKKESQQLLNYIRTTKRLNSHKSVVYYDVFGRVKGHKLLPLWYLDTQKLCYPVMYYSEDDVKRVEEAINKKLKEFNSPAIARYENHYIGGLHCWGWAIRIR